MIHIIHRNLCSNVCNLSILSILKTQCLGNKEDTRLRLFGVCYAMKKTKKRKDTKLKRKQPEAVATFEVLGLANP